MAVSMLQLSRAGSHGDDGGSRNVVNRWSLWELESRRLLHRVSDSLGFSEWFLERYWGNVGHPQFEFCRISSTLGRICECGSPLIFCRSVLGQRVDCCSSVQCFWFHDF